jgi:hypothetical protein
VLGVVGDASEIARVLRVQQVDLVGDDDELFGELLYFPV